MQEKYLLERKPTDDLANEVSLPNLQIIANMIYSRDSPGLAILNSIYKINIPTP